MQVNHIRLLLLVSEIIISINEENMQLTMNKLEEPATIRSHYFNHVEIVQIQNQVSKAFEKIAPFWPLDNLIAVNPLRGFEDISFEQAINEASLYFQQINHFTQIEDINRETIKWCQAFFDEGQASIKMPFRDQGLYYCFKHLAVYDKNLSHFSKEKIDFLHNLPLSPEEAISICLKKLAIPYESNTDFLTLLLTTLPGWASYVSYRIEWSRVNVHRYPVTKADYLAIRTIMTYLLWPKAVDMYYFHREAKLNLNKNHAKLIIEKMNKKENNYQYSLLSSLKKERKSAEIAHDIPNAQLVFCIDTRSEPFRRAIERQGNYETFGFAGFFGIPAQINNEFCDSRYISCPVLLSPKHHVTENMDDLYGTRNKILRKKLRINMLKHSYQMLKYMFITPFTLVEILGLWSGLWMLMRTVAPNTALRFKKTFLNFIPETTSFVPVLESDNNAEGITFPDQCYYAESFLRMIGLTKKFSPYVIICGHGASTENNAYQSALDCGACGGRNGGPNARILAAILNNVKVRISLAEKNIHIPEHSIFIAALHNTTTDEIEFYNTLGIKDSQLFNKLKFDLSAATKINNHSRAIKLSIKDTKNSVKSIKLCSADWAQTRPEWGLARNATFIVGPRNLTSHIDLEGRAFLHSYDWLEDEDGSLLTTILTAPMIVAQWINCQYLFSTLDNVAYGSGSKISHNITGKIGIIQGNGSDLMHGLPLQSVNKDDDHEYHEPLRLLTVVNAPRIRIEVIISKEHILQKLFKNSWVHLICIDPDDNQIYSLTSDLEWKKQNNN